MSFKKGISRLVELDTNRIKLLKIPYFWNIAKQMENIKLLINIDESKINRDTTQSYFWSKEESRGAFEISSSKSQLISLRRYEMMGPRLTFWITRRPTKNLFWHFSNFCSILWRDLKMWIQTKFNVIWDNYPFHRTKDVQNFWIEIKAKLFYLPQYSLDLAPFEIYFSKLKAGFKVKRDIRITLDRDLTVEKPKLWMQNISSE